MKTLITRILEILNSGTHPPNFNSTRWMPVARRIYVLQGGDDATKAFQKSLRTFTVSAEDLEKFSDEQLIELFEVVVRRYNEQM